MGQHDSPPSGLLEEVKAWPIRAVRTPVTPTASGPPVGTAVPRTTSQSARDPGTATVAVNATDSSPARGTKKPQLMISAGQPRKS